MRNLAEFMILNKLLFEAKKDAVAFFTDNKGKVHPIEPTPEAMAYAKKMGFKHTIGGKAIASLKATKEKVLGKPPTEKEKDVRKKILKKNLLHDTVIGTTGGALIGASRFKGPKTAAIGALVGAAAGAVGGVGEGLIKEKIFRGKSDKEIARKVSEVPYRGIDIGQEAGRVAAELWLIDRAIDKLEQKGVSGLGKASKQGLKSLVKPGIMSKAMRFLKNNKKAAAIITISTALGAALSDSVIADLSSAKVYGPDTPAEVGKAKFFTKDVLKTGLYSGKKYKYGGFGPQVEKKNKGKGK